MRLCLATLLFFITSTQAALAEPVRAVRAEPSVEKKTAPRTNARAANGSDVSAAISRLAISPARTVVFTEEREAAARTFVRNNRPEMETVLDQLRTSKPDEYRQVICDLFRTVESFTALRQEDPQRYELSLETWRTEAKTHLLAAELVGKPAERERITSELRRAVEQLADLQIRLAESEVHRWEAKLRRAEGQKKKLESGRTEFVNERLEAILLAVGRLESPAPEKKE